MVKMLAKKTFFVSFAPLSQRKIVLIMKMLTCTCTTTSISCMLASLWELGTYDVPSCPQINGYTVDSTYNDLAYSDFVIMGTIICVPV